MKQFPQFRTFLYAVILMGAWFYVKDTIASPPTRYEHPLHGSNQAPEPVMVSYEVIGSEASSSSSSDSNPSSAALHHQIARQRRSPTLHSGYGLYKGHGYGLYQQQPIYLQPQPVHQVQPYYHYQPYAPHNNGGESNSHAQAQSISANFGGVGISGASASAGSSGGSHSTDPLLYSYQGRK